MPDHDKEACKSERDEVLGREGLKKSNFCVSKLIGTDESAYSVRRDLEDAAPVLKRTAFSVQACCKARAIADGIKVRGFYVAEQTHHHFRPMMASRPYLVETKSVVPPIPDTQIPEISCLIVGRHGQSVRSTPLA